MRATSENSTGLASLDPTIAAALEGGWGLGSEVVGGRPEEARGFGMVLVLGW